MSITQVGASPYTAAVDLPAAVSKTHMTLPSGKQIPLQFLVQAFVAELIRVTEMQLTQEEADLELERTWKKGLDEALKSERTQVRKEAEKLKNTGKVREYGLGGTLALSGAVSAIGGSLLLGGAGIVAGVLQMLDQYFERRGSDAVAQFFSSFLPVSEENLRDATALFTTFASVASTIFMGMPNAGANGVLRVAQRAIMVASGTTKAAFTYEEGKISERRDEHKARSTELDAESELVRDAIQKVMDQILRFGDQVQQFQKMQIELAQKDKALKSSIFSMIR